MRYCPQDFASTKTLTNKPDKRSKSSTASYFPFSRKELELRDARSRLQCSSVLSHQKNNNYASESTLSKAEASRMPFVCFQMKQKYDLSHSTMETRKRVQALNQAFKQSENAKPLYLQLRLNRKAYKAPTLNQIRNTKN